MIIWCVTQGVFRFQGFTTWTNDEIEDISWSYSGGLLPKCSKFAERTNKNGLETELRWACDWLSLHCQTIKRDTEFITSSEHGEVSQYTTFIKKLVVTETFWKLFITFFLLYIFFVNTNLIGKLIKLYAWICTTVIVSYQK